MVATVFYVCAKHFVSPINLTAVSHTQYHIQPVKKTTKSWRHPLRKPTARAVPSAVKQQAASDDGKCFTIFSYLFMYAFIAY